jgi:glycosyltransferase involved in cell wall biosynthesis
MKKFPLVSILIPVYNRENMILDAIDSALNQTYKNIEIIIGDNNSTDGTWNIVKSLGLHHRNIFCFRNEKNIGPVYNWLECIKHSTGDFIKILFSDDLISPNFIEECLNCFDKDSAFVITPLYFFRYKDVIDNKRIYKKNTYNTNIYIKDRLFGGKYDFPVSPGAAIFRRQDILDAFIVDVPNPIGLESTKNGAGNDLLIFLLIADKYKKIKIAKKAISSFRVHGKSFSCSSDITHYYEWAKIFYVSNANRIFLNDALKLTFRIKQIFDKRYLYEYKHMKYKGSIYTIPITSAYVIYEYISNNVFNYLKNKYNRFIEIYNGRNKRSK